MNNSNQIQEKRIIGLMSGTSLDGLDIACVLFSHNTEPVDFVLEAAETVPLPTPLKERLLRIEEQSPLAIFKLNA